MRSPGMALMWEYWRRSLAYMLLMLTSTCGFMAMMYYFLARLENGSPGNSFGASYTIFLVVQILTFVSINLQSQVGLNIGNGGFPARCYSLPIETWRLVGWRMISGIMAGMLLMLITDGFFYLLSGIVPPLLGPLLAIAAASACFQALIWALADFRIMGLLTICLALFPLAKWTLHTYNFRGKELESVIARGLTVYDILFLVGYIAVFFAVGVIGVGRDRRGNAQGFPGLKEWWGKLTDRLPARSKPFQSPAAALFWAEWRRKGTLHANGGRVYHADRTSWHNK